MLFYIHRWISRKKNYDSIGYNTPFLAKLTIPKTLPIAVGGSLKRGTERVNTNKKNLVGFYCHTCQRIVFELK